MSYKSILCISDLHEPYAHEDTIPFLKAIKKKFKPDKVLSVGDEVDGHAISFHNSDPDLFSPGHELDRAIQKLQAYYTLFPNMDIVDSNHGSLVYRKQKFCGLPRSVFKEYGEMLNAPKGWKWHNDLILKMSDGKKVYICHGKSANNLRLSQTMGMSTVNGHYHEQFNTQYWASPAGLFWAMAVGCLIDDSSLAFEYNNIHLKRPILGCGIILEGQPKLIPMVLNSKGRWIGKLR